jgi:hypothetical protein
MEVGQFPRSVSAPTPNASAANAQRAPVASDLPVTQVVESAPNSPDIRLGDDGSAQRRARNLEAVKAQLKQKVTIDEESRLLISSTVSQAGAVIEQYPNEWQVKQRIYARAELECEFAEQAKADEAGEFTPKLSVAV